MPSKTMKSAIISDKPKLEGHFQPTKKKTESEGHVVVMVRAICQLLTAEEFNGTAELPFRGLTWQLQVFVLFRLPFSWRSDCCDSFPAFRLKISLAENKLMSLHVFPSA